MLARSPAAAKKRAYRRRLRGGLIVLKVEICECELAEALLAAGRLDPVRALQRAELERAAEGVLREWCDRWRRQQ